MKSAGLKVAFDDPSAGWIAIELRAGESHCLFPVEHLPHDPIKQLAYALGSLFIGEDEVTALASDGPIGYQFRFGRTGDRCTLEVVRVEDSPSGKRCTRNFTTTGSMYEIVRPFWKALRDLETRFAPEEYQSRWRAPFPHQETQFLTERFEELRRHSRQNVQR